MLIGVMNNPGLPLLEQIDRMGQEGYDFLDLTIEGPCALDPDVDKVRSLLDRHAMAVVGHTDPCLPYAYPLAVVREACFRELERCAGIFSQLGARVMNIHPCYAAPPKSKEALIQHHLEVLPGLAKMASSRGLCLVLENFATPFDTAATFSHLLEAAPGLELHLDAGHTHFGRDPATAFCKSLGGNIRHVHFSDNRGNADHHMPLGVGSIPWREVISALKKTGYDATITLEVFCQDPDMLWQYLDASRNLVKTIWEAA